MQDEPNNVNDYNTVDKRGGVEAQQLLRVFAVAGLELKADSHMLGNSSWGGKTQNVSCEGENVPQSMPSTKARLLI